MNISTITASIIIGVAAAVSLPAKASEPADRPVISRTLLFDKGDEGSKFYRIPAIATAADGTVIALADKRIDNNSDLPGNIDVVCRRSTDRGTTWSRPVTVAAHDEGGGYGDPAIVIDRKSGDVLCIMTHGNGLWQSTRDNHARIMVSRSKDNGNSWEAPTDITGSLFAGEPGKAPINCITAFATSGRAVQLKDGRIMFVLIVRDSDTKWKDLKCHVCYSDDGGYTWSSFPTAADTDGDEAKIVELSNGDLLMSIRNRLKGERKFAVSSDKGETWSAVEKNPDLIEPACNGDIIRYNESILLHSIPNHKTERRNVALFASSDEGKTWKPLRIVCPAPSAYSSLTVLDDGSVGCLTEENAHDGGLRIWFTRFDMEQLLERK